MKANVWENESIGILPTIFFPSWVDTDSLYFLGVGASMDRSAEKLDEGIDASLSQFGKSKNAQIPDSISDLINGSRFRNPDSPLGKTRKG